MLELLSFFLGVFLAPVVRPLFKPLFVEIVKLVISASQELKTASVRVKEEVEDAVAEANAAAPRPSGPNPPAPAGTTGGATPTKGAPAATDEKNGQGH